MNIIKNKNLTIFISEKGAEIQKIIKNSNQFNYFWEKNSEIWDNTSPILFPTVGKSSENKILFNEKEYSFTPHGFAKYSYFKSKMISEHEIDFILKNTDLKKDTFPFDFIFIIKYKIHKKSLLIKYTVENPSSLNNTYFSVGGHPALKCPFDENHSLEDYYIEFEKDNFLTQHEVLEDATYTRKTSNFELKNKRIYLSEHSILPTLVFSNFKSDYVSLCEIGSNKKIKVSIKKFPYIAFWKKEKGNFVCIEPWYGKGDFNGFKDDFRKKDYIVELAPKKKWKISYTINFLY